MARSRQKKEKTKNIGLDAKPPKDRCANDRCPWHGHVKLRGRVFNGRVVSASQLTAIVEWDYYHYVQKYERYERRKTRIATHNPPCIAAKAGDVVRLAECRPLSKTKSSVIFEKVSE